MLLLASSGVAWIGERGILDRRRGQALWGFAGAFVMGAAFAAIQGYEWTSKPFSLGTSSYASLYYVTTGFHMAHVIIGLGVLAALFLWTALDYFSPRRRLTISAGVMYWALRRRGLVVCIRDLLCESLPGLRDLSGVCT